jgi:YidC/Oxa1 family membrane protein insertase
MDRKTVIIVAACFVLLILWFPLVNKLYPPQPAPPTPTNGVEQATAPGATSAPAASLASTPSTPVATLIRPDQPEETLEVVHDDVRYTFTSHGGGLKEIALLNYPALAASGRRRAATSGVVALNRDARFPVLALVGESPLASTPFTWRRTDTGVQAEAVLENGLAVVKEFTFQSNYLFSARVRMENRGGQALVVPQHEVVVGTATPLNAHDDGQAVGVMWHDGKSLTDKSASWFANRTLGCFPGTPREEYRGGQDNVSWVAVHNQFFALAAMPETNAQSLVIRRELLPPPTAAELAEDSRLNKKPQAYAASVVRTATLLAPGESSAVAYDFFAGPKEYRRLARLAEQFGNELDLIMGYGGFFGFFAKGLLLGMNFLHDTFKLSYGLAIIVITILVKLVFWPLTQASTRSMKRMAALQPQMKAIQEKFKDDPAKMNRKLMEFMRENKVSPLGGCLPMLLQIPVFFGFFKMIRSAIELRGASFLWVADLSQPDTQFMIPGINFPFNVLPLLMGVTMLWQARMTPPSPGMDPVQQKMMKYMPLMFLVFLYNFSAGLTLYWTVQNLMTILQMKLTRAKEPAPAPTAPAAAPARTGTPAKSPKRK